MCEQTRSENHAVSSQKTRYQTAKIGFSNCEGKKIWLENLSKTRYHFPTPLTTGSITRPLTHYKDVDGLRTLSKTG